MQRRALWWFVLVLVVSASLRAQDTESPSAAAPVPEARVTLDQLQAKRKAVESDQKLDEQLRAKVLDLYTKATEQLQAEQAFAAQLVQLREAVDAAPKKLEDFQRQLEAPMPEGEKPGRTTDLVQAQQKLIQLEEQLRQAEEKQASLKQQVETRTRRRTEVPARLAAARAELARIDQQLAAGPAAETAAPLTEAQQALLLARKRALQAEIALLERELPAYDATAALLTAEHDLTVRRIATLKKTIGEWQERTTQLRRTEAENNVAEAEDLQRTVLPDVQPLATELVKLAKSLRPIRSAISTEITETYAEIERAEREALRLRREFEEIQQRAEAAGFTNAVGMLLRKQRSALPDPDQLDRRIREVEDRLSQVHLDRIQYQKQRSELTDVESQVDAWLRRVAAGVAPEDRDAIAAEARKVLLARSRYLDGVLRDLSSLLDRLATLDSTLRAMEAQTGEQSAFIAQHILWVRSTTPLSLETLDDIRRTVGWILSQLDPLGRALYADMQRNRLPWGLVIAICAMLLGLHHRLGKELRLAAQRASRRVTTSLEPTLRAVVITALLASVWPLLLWFLGWRLVSAVDAGAMGRAVGIACQKTAVLLLTMDLFRHVCRPSGLAIAHFSWPPVAVEALRRALRLAVFGMVPMAFLVLFSEETRIEAHRTSLGRLALMTAMLLLSIAMHRLLRPTGKLVEDLHERHAAGWFFRTRKLWYGLGVGIPLVLAVLAGAGYLYTARQLAWRLIGTGWLILAVIFVASLFKRWQVLTYRALAMRQARERRAALHQEEARATEGDADPTVTALLEEAESLAESNVKLAKLQSVLSVLVVLLGLGFIWSDVLPAFEFLGTVRLWESGIASEVIDGVEKYEWVTLKDALLAIGVFVITFVAARNVPGLIDFAVLQRLPFDAGLRYATSAVCRYGIVTLGVIMGFRLIGLGWANVQWLVAAMTVGLGFGLQEIFANFVSGLILLFERPIRVGDTVTVGGITGSVTRIRMRATTITDWDRKELVVPNREFVTGQLVNWTLTDVVLRVIINVGVAYGSDTRLATKLLYRVAEENPNVLSDPAVKVVFRSFGDSTLDFELRCFVSTPALWRTIPHELNMAIDDLFREHGIEIAFPQRDLHLRSIEVPIPVQYRALDEALRPGLSASDE